MPLQERGAPGGREVPFPTHPGGVGGGGLLEAKRAVRGEVRDSLSMMMSVRQVGVVIDGYMVLCGSALVEW